MGIAYPNIMATGDGSAGSHPQSYPVRPLVVNRGSPLEGGVRLYIIRKA